MPGDDACMISGLKRATAEIILGLSASERGTFRYHGQGKLQREYGTIFPSELKELYHQKITKSLTFLSQSIELRKIPLALLHVSSQP